MEQLVALVQSGCGQPWNKGKLVGRKAPLRLKEIWAIRIRNRGRPQSFLTDPKKARFV
jgi:hypothetical protein